MARGPRAWRGSTRLLAVALLAALAGCGEPIEERAPGAADPSGVGTHGGTATIGTHREPTTFLDWNARTTFDLLIADLVFRRLARPGPEPGSFVPDLAESWEVLPDGRSIRFLLRSGVAWEDGQPLTAADVVFSNERQAAPESSLADRKADLARIEAVSEREVVFHFRRAYAEMLADATAGHIYPEHLLREVPVAESRTHPFNRQPIASGPFRLEQWEAQQFLSFVPLASSGERPYLDRLVVRVFRDKAAIYREMEAGSLDFFRRAQIEDYERLVALEHVRGLRSPSPEYLYLVWNTARGPWRLAEVRRAMTRLVDRAAMARRFEGEGGSVAEGPVPPGHPDHDTELRSPSHDLEAARAELERAGLGRDAAGSWLGDDGRPIKLTLLTLDNPLLRDVAALIADAFRRNGFAVDVRALQYGAVDQRVGDGAFDAALYIRPASVPVDLHACFASDGLENPAHLNDEELDRLLEGSDPDRFRAAYRRVVELQPWTFLYYRSDSYVLHARLRGPARNPRDPIAVVERWWIPEELR